MQGWWQRAAHVTLLQHIWLLYTVVSDPLRCPPLTSRLPKQNSVERAQDLSQSCCAGSKDLRSSHVPLPFPVRSFESIRCPTVQVAPMDCR
eukprot:5086263-Amphidinium_carterae.1